MIRLVIIMEKFIEATGREPQHDDLERCNCLVRWWLTASLMMRSGYGATAMQHNEEFKHLKCEFTVASKARVYFRCSN